MENRTKISLKLILTMLFITLLYPSFAQKKALKIDSLITRYNKLGLFNGTALITFNNSVIYKRSFGAADKNWNINNRSNTKYQIGGASKMFTSIIILQLVEKGKLDVQLPISTYLPFITNEATKKITLQQLLTNTSGLPDFLNETDFYSEHRFKHYVSSLDFAKTYSDVKPEFEPGTKVSNCNAGYVLLGAIIEQVTGKPFPKVLKENILDSLNLKNTGCYANDQVLDNYASGYMSVMGDTKNAFYWDLTGLGASNGIYSTVDDLLSFSEALNKKRLISSQSYSILYTPQTNGSSYGFSIDSIPFRKGKGYKKLIGQLSSSLGYSTVFYRSMEDNHSIILLDNIKDDANNNKLEPLFQGLLSILYNNPYELPKEHMSYYLANSAIKIGIDETISKYYNLTSEETSTHDELAENDLNELAYSLMRNDRGAEALRVLKLNSSLFPRSYKVYHAFGEYYLKTKQLETALRNFQNAKRFNLKETGQDIINYNREEHMVKEIEKSLLVN